MPTKVTSAPTQVFDYIICGGGTAGCVIASRLAVDPNTTVLVIEAGKHNDLLENTKMTGGWGQLADTTEDWNLVTVPQTDANDRLVKLTRGRFLGGSSGINGTLCVRGVKQDFDDWGMKGWSGEEFWPYMLQAETFHPKDWFKHDPKNHGTSGPLHTEPHDPAPITNLLLKSMDSQGLPYDPDMFAHGNIPHGCGHSVRTVHQGIRSTAADFISTSGDNLWVWTETVIDKINLTKNNDGEPQATSVDAVHKDGVRATVQAKKEIIVSGGAYCSPPILLRSGIGAKTEVESFGIESKVDLPGVGQNLMDHVIVFMFYEVTKPELTNDHLIYCVDGVQKAYALWKENKTGFLSTFPFGAFGFARLDERLKDSEVWQKAPRREGRDPMDRAPSQPHVEFFATECYGGPKQFTDFPLDGKSAFALITELFGQQSRGTVTLKSKDPLDNPVVDPKYLNHPLDTLVLTEACRLANEIVMQGEGTKDIVKGAWPPSADHHTYKTREDWEPHVKKLATTCYHAAGSCKMGPADDPMAVVDERLRVRGVKGLRVADASIMPILHSGHTQLPVYGIAEKCTDMLIEDNQA
ncbi:GMC oxidoreductase [Sphaerobolus stellatus SS14]|uniref:GMC oxidoreductase n=1 Tax=Sphaerobolus stellatus (strain SS14) TaxID=990650 RepID=A0A0C9V1F3_SPHS4|nr:GMC oxidoreductase [Sphaerobolus stellatus SS14]